MIDGAAPLEVSGIRKVYRGGVVALREATFRIRAGERACLLGPNGAGKTTLIRLLTGALRPSAGAARLFGVEAGAAGFLEAKRRVGIVPQSPGMYRDLRCREYLELARALYGRGDPHQLIAAFGLEEFVDRPMATLSGGQQRKLCLAAAVMPDPELLLLDEPSTGLDPVATREVHTWLRRTMRGRTVLLCTHNLVEAEALCETVVILRSGEVLLHDSIDALRARVTPRVTLAAAQGPKELAAALAARGHSPLIEDGEVRLALADPRTQVPPLLRELLAAGMDVYESRVLQPSLEDLFLEIVGGPRARA
jgi:ABC-2 type transport system ATP-binding protein